MILEGEQVGVALSGFDNEAMIGGIDRLLHLTQVPDIVDQCRDVALRYFRLEDGVKSYHRIYEEIDSAPM